MLVSPNNDVSLRKAFEELSISNQVNCGFNTKNEKIKTSKPIETEWTDDEDDDPPIEYALRREPIDMFPKIVYRSPAMQRILDLNTVRYLEERRRQDSDVGSDKNEEEAFLASFDSEDENDFLPYETSGIDATETTLDSFKNPFAWIPYYDNLDTDAPCQIEICDE